MRQVSWAWSIVVMALVIGLMSGCASRAEESSSSIDSSSTVATSQPESTVYTISYDLAGGTVSQSNPTTYTAETPSFTLTIPTKLGFDFLGWTSSNISSPQKSVTIAQGTTVNLAYKADWAETLAAKTTPKSDAESDGKFDVFIKKLYKSGDTLYMDADYVQLLWGDEAVKKAAQDGRPDVVNDTYYIANDNPKIRKIPMVPDGKYHDYYPSPQDEHVCTIKDLVDYAQGSSKCSVQTERSFLQYKQPKGEWWGPTFTITVKNGWITDVKHVWMP